MTEEKLREVYDKYYRLVMKAAYDVLKDFDDSQDVCQEVFHKLIQKWNKVSPEDYAGWLALTARRKALDFLKKSYRKHEMTVLEQPCENGKGEHAERLIYHREATTGEDLLDAIYQAGIHDRIYGQAVRQEPSVARNYDDAGLRTGNGCRNGGRSGSDYRKLKS